MRLKRQKDYGRKNAGKLEDRKNYLRVLMKPLYNINKNARTTFLGRDGEVPTPPPQVRSLCRRHYEREEGKKEVQAGSFRTDRM